MHKIEVELFVKGLENAKEEFYIDSINEFKKLIHDFPDSELCDDALYNIGLCYFELKQLLKSIEIFEKAINHYPDSTISILEGGNEFGRTAAKAYYGIVNCYLAMGNKEKAESILDYLDEYDDSYVIANNNNITFKDLSLEVINKFN